MNNSQGVGNSSEGGQDLNQQVDFDNDELPESEYVDFQAAEEITQMRDVNINQILRQIEQLKIDLQATNDDISQKKHEKEILEDEFKNVTTKIENLEEPQLDEDKQADINHLFDDFKTNVNGLKKKNLSSLNEIQQLANTIDQSKNQENVLNNNLQKYDELIDSILGKNVKNAKERQGILTKTVDDNLGNSTQDDEFDTDDAAIKELEDKIKQKEMEIEDKYIEIIKEQEECKLN